MTATLQVPAMFAEVAYEYRLGQESAEDPKAVCPIRPSHLFAETRRRAWYEGRKARRKELGLRVHGFHPLVIPKRREVASDD